MLKGFCINILNYVVIRMAWLNGMQENTIKLGCGLLIDGYFVCSLHKDILSNLILHSI